MQDSWLGDMQAICCSLQLVACVPLEPFAWPRPTGLDLPAPIEFPRREIEVLPRYCHFSVALSAGRTPGGPGMYCFGCVTGLGPIGVAVSYALWMGRA